MTNNKNKEPQLVIRNGEPCPAIFDLEEYEKMLERLAEFDDLRVLQEVRKKGLKLRSLDHLPKEYRRAVS